MLRRSTLFLALVCLVAPAESFAQDSDQAPTTVVTLSWKCDIMMLGAIARETDSLTVPIAQELIDEGLLVNYGLLLHDWADEWNVVFYWTAADKAAFFSAWSEMNSRFGERHPDAPTTLTDSCTDHKDNIYRLATFARVGTQ